MDLVVVSEEPNPDHEAASAHSRPEPPPLRCPPIVLSAVSRSCSTHLCLPSSRTRPAQQPLSPSIPAVQSCTAHHSKKNLKTKLPQLLHESKIYRILQGGSGFV